jgi:DNA polymerase III epsilon subunit-like protein
LLTLPFDSCSPEELLLNPIANSQSRSFQQTEKKEANSQVISDDDSLWKQLQSYVATIPLLKLWNYPFPVSTNAGDTEDDVATKRMKLDSGCEVDTNLASTMLPTVEGASELMITETIEIKEHPEVGITVTTIEETVTTFESIGLDLLPSLEEISQLQLSSSFPLALTGQYFSDFPKNQVLKTDTGFFETLEYPSLNYDSLWLQSFQLEQQQKPLSIVAIDCEMCETIAGVEVTRVTVINHENNVILDVLVKPDSPIVNYRTAYSGITSEMLKNVSIRLLQVQVLLLRLIVKNTIMIGHSLENDLKSLKLFHYSNIDTTFLFPHLQGFPYRNKLKFLAKEYLQMNIQQSSSTSSKKKKKTIISATGSSSTTVVTGNNEKGHDSQEDANAALQLVLLKLEKGPLFGLPSTDNIRIPITQRLSYLKIPSLLMDYCSTSFISEEEDENGKKGSVDVISSSSSSSSVSTLKNNYKNKNYLENLVSHQTTLIKSDNLVSIIDEIKTFCNKNQTLHLTSSGKKRKVVHMENMNSIASDEEYDQPFFIHLSLSYQEQCKEAMVGFINQIQEALSIKQKGIQVADVDNSAHGLLLLTSQKPLDSIIALQEKKERILSNIHRMTSLVWTKEDEENLKSVVRLSSVGTVAFQIL